MIRMPQLKVFKMDLGIIGLLSLLILIFPNLKPDLIVNDSYEMNVLDQQDMVVNSIVHCELIATLTNKSLKKGNLDSVYFGTDELYIENVRFQKLHISKRKISIYKQTQVKCIFTVPALSNTSRSARTCCN